MWNYTDTESVADQVEVVLSPSEQLAVNNLEGKIERDIRTQVRIWRRHRTAWEVEFHHQLSQL